MSIQSEYQTIGELAASVGRPDWWLDRFVKTAAIPCQVGADGERRYPFAVVRDAAAAVDETVPEVELTDWQTIAQLCDTTRKPPTYLETLVRTAGINSKTEQDGSLRYSFAEVTGVIEARGEVTP